MVEQTARDAGLLGEHVDRDLVDRPGGEQVRAELEQLRATAAGESRVRAGDVVTDTSY